MIIESFQTLPLQNVIPSYLYQQYADDDNLQAFVASFNTLAQGYLDWFNSTALGVYTSPSVSGGLLDWIGEGIYNIPRPALSTENVQIIAGFDSSAFNTVALNDSTEIVSGTAVIASDDIYKRVLTWNLYRGDGQIFTIGWLKNRIARFINGANGGDALVLNEPPSITVSGSVFTVTYFTSQAFTDLQLAYNNGALAFPFQYSMTFVNDAFVNDGGVLQLTASLDYPTSSTGLAAGAIWYNRGTVGVVPGITPDPTAAPLYFSSTTPQQLLSLGGGNLPLTNPSNTGQLWNNGGLVSIS